MPQGSLLETCLERRDLFAAVSDPVFIELKNTLYLLIAGLGSFGELLHTDAECLALARFIAPSDVWGKAGNFVVRERFSAYGVDRGLTRLIPSCCAAVSYGKGESVAVEKGGRGFLLVGLPGCRGLGVCLDAGSVDGANGESCLEQGSA
ncbi:hypothetical protein R2F25_12320 [Streptomyces sp. UP1A-1]|nr:hypothetical protein [Streptomyces sp. UP1A-1]